MSRPASSTPTDLENAQAPDAAEVVRADEPLDRLRFQVEEPSPASGNAGVVDEQANRRMPLANGLGDPGDLGAVAHVADLVFGSDLRSDLTQARLAAGEKDELPAAPHEQARDCGADAARAAGDDRGSALRFRYRQT